MNQKSDVEQFYALVTLGTPPKEARDMLYKKNNVPKEVSLYISIGNSCEHLKKCCRHPITIKTSARIRYRKTLHNRMNKVAQLASENLLTDRFYEYLLGQSLTLFSKLTHVTFSSRIKKAIRQKLLDTTNCPYFISSDGILLAVSRDQEFYNNGWPNWADDLCAFVNKNSSRDHRMMEEKLLFTLTLDDANKIIKEDNYE